MPAYSPVPPTYSPVQPVYSPAQPVYSPAQPVQTIQTVQTVPTTVVTPGAGIPATTATTTTTTYYPNGTTVTTTPCVTQPQTVYVANSNPYGEPPSAAGSFLGGIVCDKGQISHLGFVGAVFAVISLLFFLICMSRNLVSKEYD